MTRILPIAPLFITLVVMVAAATAACAPRIGVTVRDESYLQTTLRDRPVTVGRIWFTFADFATSRDGSAKRQVGSAFGLIGAMATMATYDAFGAVGPETSRLFPNMAAALEDQLSREVWARYVPSGTQGLGPQVVGAHAPSDSQLAQIARERGLGGILKVSPLLLTEHQKIVLIVSWSVVGLDGRTHFEARTRTESASLPETPDILDPKLESIELELMRRSVNDFASVYRGIPSPQTRS